MDDFAPLESSNLATPKRQISRQRKRELWTPVLPVPKNAPAIPKAHPTRGRPSASWVYLDERGRVLMHVFRFDHDDGGKDILPLTYCTRGELLEWRWKGLTAPRPLYNLHELHLRPNASVLIVEGEKSAEAAKFLFPDYVVTTWPNGSKAAVKTDWSPLARRNVTLWPDADDPGATVMEAVAKCLNGVAAASIKQTIPPDKVPLGWDAADVLEEINSGKFDRKDVLSLVEKAEPRTKRTFPSGNREDNNKGGNSGKRPSPSDLLNLVGEIELWHTPTGEGWATIWNGKGHANYALNDLRLETLLVHKFMSQGIDPPGRESMGKLISMMKARAIFGGPEHSVHIRVAGDLQDAVYLDQGSADWKALKLTSSGWEQVDRPPVKFRRGSGMRAIPLPDLEGSIEDLRNWINCQSENDWMLCLSWIMAALCPEGPYPILVLSGPPGAAKSTTAKVIRSLVDPSTVPLSRIPKDPRDLYASVENSRILSYDNISKIPAWLADDLCMIATGSGVRERQFHTNTGEVLIEGGCPIIVNGIGDLATRTDLADRSLLVNLTPPTRRRAEFRDTNDSKALWPEFESELPRLMGGLCGVFCAAMKFFIEGQQTPGGNPRMMDFAVWANAVGMAMGWEAGAFDNAYNGNRIEADEVALEDCPIWEHLQAVFPNGEEEWKGSATELKNKFLTTEESPEKRKKLTSMQPSTIAQHVQRIMPVLNKMGWNIQKPPRTGTARRWIIKPPELQ